MKQNTLIVRCLLALSASVIAVSVSAPLYAWSQSASDAGPYLIATVDLERVFNESSLRHRRERDLDAMKTGFEKSLKDLEHDASMLQQDLEMMQPGTQKFKEAEEKLKQAVIAYEAMIEMSETKLTHERLEAKRDIYRSMLRSVGEYAKTNGIAFVVTDDGSIDLDAATEVQLVQQMALRRLVYAQDEFDITTEIIKWIDSNFK